MSGDDPIEEIRRLAAARDAAAAEEAHRDREARYRSEMRAAAWRERREARLAALNEARGPRYWVLWAAALVTTWFDALYPPAELTEDDPARYAALLADRSLRLPSLRRGEDGRRSREAARIDRRPLIIGGRRVTGVGLIVAVAAVIALLLLGRAALAHL